jgi:membrane protein DedA with SNARE-associated domain
VRVPPSFVSTLGSLGAGGQLGAFGPSWLDPNHLLADVGSGALWVCLAIIFAECGLLVGFFLPGDTLLFSVGLFVSQGLVPQPLIVVCIVLSAGALLGNAVGYEIGRRAGPAIFTRPNSRLFSQHNVERAHAFFDRYGVRAVVLARFVPIVRTFITVVAGVGRMDRRLYLAFSAIGGIVWATGVTLLGYFLGHVAFVRQHIQPHLDLILIGVVVVSVLPALAHIASSRGSGPTGRASDPDQ